MLKAPTRIVSRAVRSPLLVVSFLLVVLPARGAVDGAEAFRVAVSDAVAAELVPAVEEAVLELRKRRRYREANTLCERLRAIDPDNELVRKHLKGRYRTEPLDDEAELLDARVERYIAAAHGLMQEHDVLSRGLAGAAALGNVLIVHPDHAGVRAELGYERHEGEWFLAETLNALRGRGLVEGGEGASSEGADIGAVEHELGREELRMQDPENGLRWTSAFRAGSVYAIGSDWEPEDVRQACVDAARAEAAYRRWIGKTAGLTIRLFLIDREELEALALRHDGIDDRVADWIGVASSMQVDRTYDLVLWDRDPVLRRDAVALHVFLMNCRTPLGADGTPWVRDGAGAWFTQRVNGSSTVFGTGVYSGGLDREADWFDGALALGAGDRLPRVTEVTSAVRRMTRDQTVAAYALTAYLAEGTSCVRDAFKWSRSPDHVFEHQLHLRSVDLDARMLQWLQEVREFQERAEETKTRSSKKRRR